MATIEEIIAEVRQNADANFRTAAAGQARMDWFEAKEKGKGVAVIYVPLPLGAKVVAFLNVLMGDPKATRGEIDPQARPACADEWW